MKPVNEMTVGEFGAFVQSHLRKSGIEVVLSGGATVSIYSSNKYVSHDLDFINMYSASRKDIRASMIEMAFTEVGRYFKHPDTQFLVEFPPGPLSVGKEPVKQISKIRFITGVLNVISPTDCVKDRLAAYFHWDDQQSLTQAILVCTDHKIDFEEIRRWSKVEGKLEEYENIRQKLQIRSPEDGF